MVHENPELWVFKPDTVGVLHDLSVTLENYPEMFTKPILFLLNEDLFEFRLKKNPTTLLKRNKILQIMKEAILIFEGTYSYHKDKLLERKPDSDEDLYLLHDFQQDYILTKDELIHFLKNALAYFSMIEGKNRTVKQTSK